MKSAFAASSALSFSLLALGACSSRAPAAASSGAAAAIEGAVCATSTATAGAGLRDDLLATMGIDDDGSDSVEVPGALRVTRSGGVDRVETFLGVSTGLDVGTTAEVTARLGDGLGDGPIQAAARRNAAALYDAMSLAVETQDDGVTVRSSPKGFVTCSRRPSDGGATECTFARVHSVSPSTDDTTHGEVCGDGACPTSTLFTGMGVLEDLSRALDPKFVRDGVDVPGALVGDVRMGFEAMTTAAAVSTTAPGAGRSPLDAEIAGTIGSGRPSSAGGQAAAALYQAMVDATETRGSTGAPTRTSPGGRIVCTSHFVEPSSNFFACWLKDVRGVEIAEGTAAAPDFCAQ